MKYLMSLLAMALLSVTTVSAQGNQAGVLSAVYKGADFFGNQCYLALSLKEEGGKHVFLTKVAYSIHGQAMPDVETSLYKYDIQTNRFGDAETGTGVVSLGGALLSDESEADLNQLQNYENNGSLVYFVRIDTSAPSAEDFEHALEEVIGNPSLLQANGAVLDQVTSISLKVSHHGHYDGGACTGMKLLGMTQVNFNLDDDHDDHSDDDDHDDHDHHDHGDHDEDEDEDDHDHDHDHGHKH